jgi:hypothetical protein
MSNNYPFAKVEQLDRIRYDSWRKTRKYAGCSAVSVAQPRRGPGPVHFLSGGSDSLFGPEPPVPGVPGLAALRPRTPRTGTAIFDALMDQLPAR